MALRVPYEKVAKVAVESGYNTHKEGVYIHDIATELGFTTFRSKRFINKKKPVIVSVKSVNFHRTNHAVVFYKGKVYDPSRKKKVTLERVRRSKKWIYRFEVSEKRDLASYGWKPRSVPGINADFRSVVRRDEGRREDRLSSNVILSTRGEGIWHGVERDFVPSDL
jgi:hypothetical protein